VVRLRRAHAPGQVKAADLCAHAVVCERPLHLNDDEVIEPPGTDDVDAAQDNHDHQQQHTAPGDYQRALMASGPAWFSFRRFRYLAHQKRFGIRSDKRPRRILAWKNEGRKTKLMSRHRSFVPGLWFVIANGRVEPMTNDEGLRTS